MKKMKEFIKNKGGFYVIFIIIIIIIITLYSNKEFNFDDMTTCEVGKYRIPSQQLKDLNEILDLYNIKPDYITIIKEGDNCVSYMKLKEPMFIFNTEVYAIPITVCNMRCMAMFNLKTDKLSNCCRSST